MKPKLIKFFFYLIIIAMVVSHEGYGQQNFDSAQKSSIITVGATPHLISDQFKFTEGPAVDKSGNVFFTDQPNDKIWKYDVNGKLSVFLDKTGRSNGMYFDP